MTLNTYASCFDTDVIYAECHNQVYYAECCYTVCCYAECHGTTTRFAQNAEKNYFG